MIIKHPGLTARELSRKLGMSDGGVAGNLNFMEKAGFVVRSRDSSNVSTWTIGSDEDKNYAEVTYVGNHDYRVYLEDTAMEGSVDLADELCRLLRKIVPELKYARVFTETVRVPVRRNYLTKL